MRRSAALNRIVRQLPLLLVTAVMVTPLVWMLGASLKSEAEFATSPTSLLPRDPRPANYVDVFDAEPFGRYLLNTVLLCLGSVAGTLASCTLAAYAFARLSWPGRDWVFALVIATLLLPWQATMIPKFLLLRELGLYNSLAALVVPTFLGDAFSIFLLRQFFRTLPAELMDAARIDGCSEWGVFWRVVLPLSRPALVAVAILQLVAAWNDYGGPLLYLSDPNKFPLAYGLERYVSAHSTQTHLLMAASVMFAAPIVAIFFVAQNAFTRGVTTTGLKQ